jgi:hypothetical protein
VKKTILFIIIFLAIVGVAVIPSISHAESYGQGLYNANVPYGKATSLSISTNGNVSIPITPTSSGVLATGSTSTITVTSTDVNGYSLYIRALTSTSMNNLGTLLPASANGSPAALAVDTWGYNLDASNNFTGISLSDTLIHSITAPAPSGDITNVTYGIKLDMAKPAGNYVASMVYTAVPQTD